MKSSSIASEGGDREFDEPHGFLPVALHPDCEGYNRATAYISPAVRGIADTSPEESRMRPDANRKLGPEAFSSQARQGFRLR